MRSQPIIYFPVRQVCAAAGYDIGSVMAADSERLLCC